MTTGRRRAVWLLNVIVPAIPVVTLATLGHHRRWVSEDAYISLRVAVQILEGYGPVFNIGERVETHTNPLWVAILAVAGHAGWDLPRAAMWLGLLFSIAGLLAALTTANMLWQRLVPGTSNDAPALLLPVGAMSFAAIPVAWDFVTSGLETGLTFGWLGGSFWALAYCGITPPPSSRWRWIGAAFLMGLGPLIRPDLAVFSAGFLLALFTLHGVGRGGREMLRAALPLGLAGGLAPVTYQVFRMGYYATLTPNTALAKEAGMANWEQGWIYLRNFVEPYWAWIPITVLIAVGLDTVRRATRQGDVIAAMLIAAPCVTAILHALYIVRVGGDFMHGRLLLPAAFALFMPFALVRLPLGHRLRHPDATFRAMTSAIVLIWAIVATTALRLPDPTNLSSGGTGIVDERAYYVELSGNSPLVSLADYGLDTFGHLRRATQAREYARDRPDTVVFFDTEYPLAPRTHPDVALVTRFDNIGLFGYAVGPRITVIDRYGLADPIGSRIRITERGRPGHEKSLPTAWAIARLSAADPETVPEPGVEDARHALSCGDLARLLDAVSEPLTLDRFLANLRSSWTFHTLRVPHNPTEARRVFCTSAEDSE